MSNKKKMESLELSPINQENYSDLEVICKLIQDIIDKYGSEAMAFVAIDVNNEEKIGFNEFSSELQNTFDIDEDKIQVIFEMFDLDQDGFISKTDWGLSFEQYPLKLVQYEQISESQNSEIHHIENDRNQIPVSIIDTPNKGKESKRYQTDQTPSRELVEIQTRLDSSPGLDGLMRKCNSLRVQFQTQSSVQSQFYQQLIDSSLEQRKQEQVLNHLLPSNFHKVQVEQVKQIFGDLRTPAKEQQNEVTENGVDETGKSQNQLNGTRNLNNPSYQKDKSQAFEEAKTILSQKIVPSQQQDEEIRKQSKESEDKNSIQQGQIYEKNSLQYTNPLFVQSSNKMLDLPYDQRFSRILQSSSPIDQYKYYSNSSNIQNTYQVGYSNIKREVQQQQQQYKPKRDLKNNFQSYLSLIGLGSNRSNHHGSTNPSKGNQLYYTNKYTGPSSQLQPISQSGLSQLYRASSTERASLISSSTLTKPFQANNQNNSKTNKLREGLEGIINKINTKKDYLFQNKGQVQGQSFNQQRFLQNKNQIQINQYNVSNKSNNINNLLKSRIHPISNQQSKQAEIEESLEKIRLISMSRNANFPHNYSKENDQQNKNAKQNQQLKSPTQQQSILSQPLTNLSSSNQLRSTNQGSYIPSLTSSINFGQKFQTTSTQQYSLGEKIYSSQPLANSKVLGSSLKSNILKSEEISQQTAKPEPILSQQVSNPKQELKLKNSNSRNNDQQQKNDSIPEQSKPADNGIEQNDQMFSPEDFEDYEDKFKYSGSKNNVNLLDD